jgi:hypothetical protein
LLKVISDNWLSGLGPQAVTGSDQRKVKAMFKLPVALVVSLLALGAAAGAANAQGTCSGDFENVDGNWIATKYCQRDHARHVAAMEGSHLTSHPVMARDETPGQFCRFHVNDIRTSTYCSEYND